MKERINLGRWTVADLDALMKVSSSMDDAAARIEHISARFLDTPYREFTLTGDVTTPEMFVIDLEGLDCFTFLDYVEALRTSHSFTEFRENLKKVRYRSGAVAYEHRNHFFTDWTTARADLVRDATGSVGHGKSRTVQKVLNQKDDGTSFLPGIPCTRRDISYIPSESLDASVIWRLQTGDYAGIYSDLPGLDVSHVGILIKRDNTVLIRHASSAERFRKVVDEDFKEYMKDKPGIVVLRPGNGVAGN